MNKFLAVIFGVLLLLLLVSGPFVAIGPGERGVEVRRGRVTGHVYSEGWYFYNSITDDIVQFDTRSKLATEQIAAASQDLQDVNMEIAAQYRVSPDNVSSIVKNIGKQRDIVEKLIDPAIQETVKAATAKFPVGDIILKRAEVKSEIETNLIARLSEYGILIEEVSIKNILFSDQFTQAIENKQVAEQGKLQTEFEAQSAIAAATGKAEAQRIEGEALRANPEVLQLRKVEKWNGVLPIYMIGGASPLINLP